MRISKASVLALAAGLAAAAAATAQSDEVTEVSSKLVDTGGQTVGQVLVREARSGLLIQVEVDGLPPGPHGMHLHQIGDCDSLGGFETAGDHISAQPEQSHGLRGEGEPHTGDLPNIIVGEDGLGMIEVETWRLPLSGAHHPLLDADGSALVIHANADDHVSPDGGGSGARIACAAFTTESASTPASAE